jgi:hypothetical protein
MKLDTSHKALFIFTEHIVDSQPVAVRLPPSSAGRIGGFNVQSSTASYHDS